MSVSIHTAVSFISSFPTLRLRHESARPLSKPRRLSFSVSCSSQRVSSRQTSNPPPLLPSSRAALFASFATIASGISVPLIASHYSTLEFESHYYILLYTTLFGVLHSGLASLRPIISQILGERLYRVIFALLSLPSAVFVITYFIAHRYDGVQLWQVQGIPHMHDFVIFLTTVSFLFLYPATFNLLEVAAIQKPSFQIYESGIMRISRHPQLIGQILWCFSHTLWMGNSFSVAASAGLIAHHFFGAWNGDRRLRDKYGDEWSKFANRTSIVPFAAALSGQQQLDVREFLKPAYVGVLLAVLGFYKAHPLVLRIVGELHL